MLGTPGNLSGGCPERGRVELGCSSLEHWGRAVAYREDALGVSLGSHVGVMNSLQHHPGFIVLPVLEPDRAHGQVSRPQTRAYSPAFHPGLPTPDLWAHPSPTRKEPQAGTQHNVIIRGQELGETDTTIGPRDPLVQWKRKLKTRQVTTTGKHVGREGAGPQPAAPRYSWRARATAPPAKF